LITSLTEVIQQWYMTGLTYRDVHVKGHAAVRAEFTVESDLSPDLRVGLFREPRTYPGWIRFSNASHFPAPDIKGDIRGMAVKLMGVPGKKLLPGYENDQSHDLVFLSTNVFLTKTATDFYRFVQSGALKHSQSLGDYVSVAWFILRHINVGTGLLAASRKFANLLEIAWYSATPYLLGERAVKYKLRPRQKPVSTLPKPAGNNFLRERLSSDLRTGEAFFDFMIQFQKDPKRQPIEDALVPWDEKESPFQKVATLRLPKQEIDSPEQRAFAENLSMNIWRCLPEHRPLGGVNRVRKEVYLGISAYRHARNGVPVAEPTA